MIGSFFPGIPERQRKDSCVDDTTKRNSAEQNNGDSHSRWAWLLLAGVVAAATGFFWFQVRRRGFDWHTFISAFAGLRWKWLLLSFVLVASTYYGRALRWAVLMRPVKQRSSLWNLLSATVIGFTAITLLGRPGELVRPYLVSLKERVSLSSQLASLLLERIFDLLMALLVFGFALSRVQKSGVDTGPAMAWILAVGGKVAAFVAILSVLVLLLIRHFSETMRVRLLDAVRFLPPGPFHRVERFINAFVQGVEATRSGSSLTLLSAYTVLEWVLIAASTVSLINAFGALRFSLVDALIFLGFVSFGAVIQLPGIGGGVQVAAVVVLTELFGVPLEIATSVSILFWISNFVVVVPFGLVLTLHEGVSWRRLSHLRSEVES